MLSLFKNTTTPPAAAQTQLYHAHYRRIYNTCLRIIGNAMDAEEAMHDTFLKIFNHVYKINDEKAFYAWSQSIAIRTAIDRVRKKKIYFEPVENLSIAQEEPADDEQTTWSIPAIKQKINELPTGYRLILSMRLFDDCEFAHIAEALKIKESTVRSQYVRGKQKLLQALKNKC
jgi:RNA polymerase sigma-70 factor (ECF subfamily)